MDPCSNLSTYCSTLDGGKLLFFSYLWLNKLSFLKVTVFLRGYPQQITGQYEVTKTHVIDSRVVISERLFQLELTVALAEASLQMHSSVAEGTVQLLSLSILLPDCRYYS